jgi:hypothetical protein
MKTFAAVRQTKPTIKKIDGMKVEFQKVKAGVAVNIEGDLLDVYPNEQQATKFATEFIKQLKVKQ